jgi:hypothetical protein
LERALPATHDAAMETPAPPRSVAAKNRPALFLRIEGQEKFSVFSHQLSVVRHQN